MPQNFKDDMWKLIQRKFILDPLAKEWVFMSLDKKWRTFKTKVKSKWITKKERDNRVLDDQFKWLLDHWETSKAKEKESVGKANRLKVKSTHTAGSKSFAVRRAELAKANGSDPSRVDLYIATHTHKDGRPINDADALAIEKLNEVGQTQGKQDKPGPNDALAIVLGKDKRFVRTYGLGPSPDDLWGTKPTRFKLQKIAADATKIVETKVGHLEDDMCALKRRVKTLEAIILQKFPDVELDNFEISSEQDDQMLNLDVEHENASDDYASARQIHSDQEQDGVNLVLNSLVPHLHSTPAAHELEQHNIDGNVVASMGNNQTTESQPLYNYESDTSLNLSVGGFSQLLAGISEDVFPQQTSIYVLLKSLRNPSLSVAQGMVFAKNPTTLVGGQELGSDFSEIYILHGIKKDESLVRPHSGLKTIGDSIGRTIAWPSCFVVDSKHDI